MAPAIFSRRISVAASLNQEKGRADIDRHQAIIKRKRGIEDGAAIGIACRIDQNIEPAEQAFGRRHDGRNILRRSEIGHNEFGAAAPGFQIGGDRPALLGVPAGQHDAGQAAGGEFTRYCFANPLAGTRR
jgi:hypothetical protein